MQSRAEKPELAVRRCGVMPETALLASWRQNSLAGATGLHLRGTHQHRHSQYQGHAAQQAAMLCVEHVLDLSK